MMIFDEFGYYANHFGFNTPGAVKLTSAFKQIFSASMAPVCSFSTHRLRRQHPFLRRFFHTLSQRSKARVHQVPEPLGFIPPLTQVLWDEKSLLYWAVAYRDWTVVECLLHAGFDPNLKTGIQPSAMHQMLEMIRAHHHSVPHSTLWLMMEKGGLLTWVEIEGDGLKPPPFVFQIYEEVQTKIMLERLPKAEGKAHNVGRI